EQAGETLSHGGFGISRQIFGDNLTVKLVCFALALDESTIKGRPKGLFGALPEIHITQSQPYRRRFSRSDSQLVMRRRFRANLLRIDGILGLVDDEFIDPVLNIRTGSMNSSSTRPR